MNKVPTPPFDPTFDDCAGDDAWQHVPLVQVVPGVYPTFSIVSRTLTEADICGQRVRLARPLEVRVLLTSDGTLWMSDVPQERAMMYANAIHSRGRVLVGGLGLGMYPQYAAPYVDHLIVVERDAPLVEVVRPTVEVALAAHRTPLTIHTADVESVLEAAPTARCDTIFLDTWHTLDAAALPYANQLRRMALPHLTEGGVILLWGYAWIMRLFLQACAQILSQPPEARPALLDHVTSPQAADLLGPVVDHYSGQRIGDMEAALAWCRQYGLEA